MKKALDPSDDSNPAATPPSPRLWLEAFDAWVASRAQAGAIRERSSIAVYRSMWGALTAWSVGHGLALDALQPAHLHAYLRSRGGVADISPRHAWRLLTLVDAVTAHRALARRGRPNGAARQLLESTPEWRHANAAHKTPLPEHLSAAEARRLVDWLRHPSPADAHDAGARGWQSLRNRTAVALQLGAGLTPGDVRAARVAGVHGRPPRGDLPWKIALPAHGGSPAREAPLAPWAGRLLRQWLDARAAHGIGGTVLFPATRDGRPWGKVAQYGAAQAVLAAAGLAGSDGGSFKLRHTFALRQLRRGHAPEEVARWLGLADVAALARYRKVLFEPVDII